MILRLDHDQLIIDDADDLRRLHAVIDGGSVPAVLPDGVRADPDGSHLWVDVEALAARLRAAGSDVGEGFASMVEFARSHGYASEDGSALRVHVEADA
ncbi:MAG: hypothetical protein CL424_05800 [Acidimicrobiaceae bacterium]|nr:hypothetical protein [Acidimicrobiaceae bacterium]